jgi:hypothetical protein
MAEPEVEMEDIVDLLDGGNAGSLLWVEEGCWLS